MKTTSLLSASVASALLLAAAPVFAQATQDSKPAGATCACCAPAATAVSTTAKSDGKLTRVGEKDAAWADQARKSYPLDVCVISGEKLGSMGKPADYVYRVADKPDQLVRFCCAGCEGDFTADPAKAISKIEAGKSGKAVAKDPHAGHSH